MKNLFISGFLGGEHDLKPFAVDGDENVFVDLEFLLKTSKSVTQLKEIFYQKYGVGPFNRAICYSFGGRIISRLGLSIDHTFFISSNFLNLEEDEIQRDKMASKWLRLFRENFETAEIEWNKMPLFASHVMSSYRKHFDIDYRKWSLEAVENYFNNFFILEEPASFKSTDYYICGALDQKYSRIGKKLVGKLNVETISKAGHRCCYEHPEALKKLIIGVE